MNLQKIPAAKNVLELFTLYMSTTYNKIIYFNILSVLFIPIILLCEKSDCFVDL
jgi:hypothetical protein